MVQIQWLEVKHPIFNWFEFQLLNFQLNKNGFETSLTGSLFVNFHSKNLLNSKRNCLQHVSLVSSLSTKILFLKGAPLKTISIVDEFLWEYWDLERTVCMLTLNRQAVPKPTLGISNNPLFLNAISDQVTFFNYIAGFNLVTTLSNIRP